MFYLFFIICCKNNTVFFGSVFCVVFLTQIKMQAAFYGLATAILADMKPPAATINTLALNFILPTKAACTFSCALNIIRNQPSKS